MCNKLTFQSVTGYKDGMILTMLSECYAKIWNDKLNGFFSKFDKDVFEYPDTVGACTFITYIDDEVVGLGSYDPRKAPELGVIGHNCVLPEFQGIGFGKMQIKEILRRFRLCNFIKATVCTGDTEFFEPARRMYEACGMHETKHCTKPTDLGWRMIHYEIEL